MDILELVRKHGIENILVMAKLLPLRKVMCISYTSSSDTPSLVPCHIEKGGRYDVYDGYKLTLVPIEEVFGKESFYQSDFNSLVEQGHIQVYCKIEGERAKRVL